MSEIDVLQKIVTVGAQAMAKPEVPGGEHGK